MREGLKEAKEFEKTYRLYSIQEMMCGASHFEKVGTGEKGENYESRPGRNQSRKKKEGQKDVNVRSNPYYSVRNGSIPTGELPHSRAQDSEVSVIGGPRRDHVYVTPQDMGEEFMRWAEFYGPNAPFMFNNREYILIPGSDGNQYVYVPDDSAGYEYRQLQWKRQRDGTYVESLVTPMMTEHRHTKIPEPMTPEIALRYYQNAQRDERVAKPRDGRDFITRALYDGNPPLDKWDVNAELEGDTTPPVEYYLDSTDDSKGEPDTVMAPGDALNDYQQRKTEGRRIKETSKNPLFASSDALSYAMIKPSKFRTLFEDGSGDEKIFAIGEIVLGKEKVNEIKSRPSNPEANTNAIAKESARILGDPKVAPKIPNLLKRVDDIVKEWVAESPAFNDIVVKQKAKMEKKMKGDNARVQEDIKRAYKESDNPDVGAWRDVLIDQANKKKKEIQNTRVIPRRMSMDEAQGLERRNKDTFVPSEEGGAMSLSTVQNTESILPDELALAAQRGSLERDEEARKIANERNLRDTITGESAIRQRDVDTKVKDFQFAGGNVSPGGYTGHGKWNEVNKDIRELQEAINDAMNGVTSSGESKSGTKENAIETALISARAPVKEKVQTNISADWRPPEEDISEYGQGKKLTSLGGEGGPGAKMRVIPKGGDEVEEQTSEEQIGKSASFEEMLKSANARQWAEKGLPSGSMEATLPAYYRTVTMGNDRDAINVYEHKKMPVGGKGISVKTITGIGPKYKKEE